MKIQSPEQELLKIYPRSYKMTSYLTGIGLLVLLAINWQKFDVNTFNPLEHLQVCLLAIAFVFSLFPRLIITTTRVAYTFGPFFKQEIGKDKVEDIYISPPLNYIRLTQRDTIWTKPLFGKARHPNTAEYWYKNGILNFKHDENIKLFRQISLSRLGLAEFSREQTDEIIKTLEHYWQFKASRVELSPVDQMPDDITTKDVGKSVIVLVFIAILLGFIGFLIPISFLNGLHFAVESYIYLIPSIILGSLFCYWMIKRENKSYPLIAAICAGVLWGLSLYFTALQTNRVYSEKNAQTILVPMTLSSNDGQSQIWMLDEKWQKEIGLNEIYIHQNWQGYSTQVEQGKTYQVKVKQGWFKDYFVDTQSFVNIKVISKGK